MPDDKALAEIFKDILAEYKLFVMRSDRLIEKAKRTTREQEKKKDETD